MWRESKYDCVELSDISQPAYTESPVAFMNFAEQVQITSSILSHTYSSVVRKVQTLAKKFGIKIIRPLKKLCLKNTSANNNISQLQDIFLSLVIKYKVFQEALPIIQSKMLPKQHETCFGSYLYRSFEIFFQLQKYEQALQTFNMLINNIQAFKFGDTQRIQLALTSIFTMRLFPQVKNNMNQSIVLQTLKKGSYYREQKQIISIVQQMMTNNYQIASVEKRQKIQLNFSELNRKIYHMYNKKTQQMIKYVKSQIQGSNQRIKINNVKSQNLNKYDTLVKINKYGNICTYDTAQQIMYLNHRKYTDADIDRMISNNFQMYTLLKKKKQMESQSSYAGGFKSSGLSSMLGKYM